MSRKSKGGGSGRDRGASSSTMASHVATNNKFAALLLDSVEEQDIRQRGKQQKDIFEASASRKADEKSTSGCNVEDKDEGDKARSLPERPSTTTTTQLRRPLFFLDLEMTGLDPETDSILEIAVIVTDGDDLDRRVMGPSVAITTSREKIDAMNAWCVDHHGRSGLTERCLDPGRSVPHDEAERMVCEFVRRHMPPPRQRRRGAEGVRGAEGRRDDAVGDGSDDDDVDEASVGDDSENNKKSIETKAPPPPSQLIQDKAILAGNSIHTDLSFIRRHMPLLASLCSYRLVDVSCLAELARRWAPSAFYSAPEKRNAHEALKDVEDSIEELKYWRRVMFKSGPEVSRAVAKFGGPRRR